MTSVNVSMILVRVTELYSFKALVATLTSLQGYSGEKLETVFLVFCCCCCFVVIVLF